jgi:anti-sigma factor RsiW
VRPATCRDQIGRLCVYVDEDLPGEARRRLDRHLMRCRGCAAYLKSYGRMVEIVRAVFPEPAMPEGLVQAILSARVM